MTVFVYTLGCRLNQCESEAIADAFSKEGYTITSDSERADLVIVNSCTVTSKAEQKARRMIRIFNETAECVVVTGCYAELNKEEIIALSNKVVIFSLKEKASILDLPEFLRMTNLPLLEGVKSFTKEDKGAFVFDPTSFSYHSRAYLKIQDGCDNFCGYCRTTIARGKSIWLESDEVIRRAKRLEELGYHEIMLTGVNLTNYNHNNGGLGVLLDELLKNLGDDIRIRLSSMEPDGVDERLIAAISDKRVFPHFHIPIQSASDKVLHIVNRVYSISHVDWIIKSLREVKDDPFIACDIIAGLPGEDDEDAKETYDFLLKNDFSAMHVFPYSVREGTPLYLSRLHVPERVRDERAKALRELSAKQSEKYILRQLNKETEIICEKGSFGTTGNYLKAKIDSKEKTKEGSLYRGIFTSVSPLVVTIN